MTPFMFRIPGSEWGIDDMINPEIMSISFHTMLGNFSQTLKFPQKVTVFDAVKEVEKWLSEPMTEEYFNTIKDKDDLGYYSHTDFENRGDLMCGHIFLERISIDENGNAKIHTGS